MQKIVWMLGVVCIFLMLLCLDAKASVPQIQHRQVCENPGTRSEIVHGSLSIGGYDVPDKFKKLTYNGRTFVFKQRTHKWGEDGYMEVDYEPIVESKSLMKLEMLRKGFYVGNERLQNTPKHWVFVTFGENKNAFVGWNKFYTLYGEHDVPDIPRQMEKEDVPAASNPSMRKKITLN